MSVDAQVGGTVDTQLVNLSGTSATVLLDNDSSDLLIHSIAYASAAGDTLTLDTYTGSTASRLRQVAISANADAAYTTPFVLKRTHDLRGTLSSGNATAIRITYTIKDS